MDQAIVALLRHGGSHYIRPVVHQFGFEPVEPGKNGVPVQTSVMGRPVIVFTRDPRDRMVSTWRWRVAVDESEQPLKRKHFETMQRVGRDQDEQIAWLLSHDGFMTEMIRWAEAWCNDDVPALRIKYEDRSVAQVTQIAKYLGRPRNVARDTNMFVKLNEHARTVNPVKSDWRTGFGPASNEAWGRGGGSHLLQLMGYE